MTRILIAACLAIVACLAIYVQRETIQSQTSAIAALKQSVNDKDADILLARAERDLARTEAATEVARINAEIALRDRLATEAKARAARIEQDLARANQSLRDYAAASPDFDRCMSLPVPDSVLPRPEAGPTTEVEGYSSAATRAASDASPGVGHRTIGDALKLANHLQGDFRACESDKAALRTWVAAGDAPQAP